MLAGLRRQWYSLQERSVAQMFAPRIWSIWYRKVRFFRSRKVSSLHTFDSINLCQSTFQNVQSRGLRAYTVEWWLKKNIFVSVSWQHGNYRSFYASSKVSPLHTIHSALDLNYAYLWCLSCVLYLKERYPISGPNNDSLQWFFVNVGKPRRKIIRRKYKLHVRGKRLKGNASNIWVLITRKNFKDV